MKKHTSFKNSCVYPDSWCGNPYHNDYTESTVKTMLNDYYYNGLDNQTCYNGKYSRTTCSFSSIGLNEETKGMIDDSLWYLGGNNDSNILTNAMYDAERRGTWSGKIALMYLSDYGYATDLSLCIQTLDNYNYTSCGSNNWLNFRKDDSWTLTKFWNNTGAVYYVALGGYAPGAHTSSPSITADNSRAIRPTLYLKPNIEIVQNGNDGSKEKPYELSY